MKDAFHCVSPKSTDQFKKYYHLRWQILRKPYGQVLGSEKDDYENVSFHQMVLDPNKKVVAVGRIHCLNINQNIAQIRFMAVHNHYVNKGIGREILVNLEMYANNNNIKKIILHSRLSAIGFYLKNGYKKIKKTHILYNQIHHWLMQKELK